MRGQRFKLFLALFLDNSTTVKFFVGVLVGMAFSIAVILSTIGIMDGFQRALKIGLKKSTGEIVMSSQGGGFFKINKSILEKFKFQNIDHFSALVQTESFLIYDEDSRGVLVRGIDDSYAEVVKLPIFLKDREVAIGSEIAKLNKIKIGDEIVLAFAKGNASLKSMPALERFKVARIVTHGVYQKDSHMVYIRLETLQRILELGHFINMISLNLPQDSRYKDDIEKIESNIPILRKKFEAEYYFKPYWREFAPLLEAVRVEKVMISLILQMVVVISIFNILAFIIFINEKKSKELFLFKALGLSKKAMSDLWLKLVFLIWGLSCLLSLLFVQIFKFSLLKLSLFELPSEIYVMPRIELYLSWSDYLFVWSLTLVWILIITFYLLRRLKQKSLLAGLRQEFA
ncbi:MAG: ABC transporter permease [Bacteriovorax sp.]|nr:ABC transporter permease [Bacteriovorax sp.]